MPRLSPAEGVAMRAQPLSSPPRLGERNLIRPKPRGSRLSVTTPETTPGMRFTAIARPS